MDIDYQIIDGKVKIVETNEFKEKIKRKKKTLIVAEKNLRKIAEDKIKGRFGIC